jgi:NADPH-dependent curcumin reductase
LREIVGYHTISGKHGASGIAHWGANPIRSPRNAGRKQAKERNGEQQSTGHPRRASALHRADRKLLSYGRRRDAAGAPGWRSAGPHVVPGNGVHALRQSAAHHPAKIYGGRVVGIAGNPEKCQLAVEKCGFDACVNRDAKDFEAQLKAACPQGVGVHIETLGGRALDAVVPLLNINARIVAVGQASLAHIGEDAHRGRCQNTRTFMQEVISRRLTVRDLITSDHVKGRVKEFDTKMKGWIAEGRLRPMEDILVGLEKAPEAFQGVFEERNRGTRLVKVAD